MNRYPDLLDEATILAASPDLNDSVSWWRNWGPVTDLCAGTRGLSAQALDFMRAKACDWATIEASDLMLFNRPFDQKHYETIRFALMCSRPVWVDFDDLIWKIPCWNPASDWYGEAQRGNARESAAFATVVTTSTPYLASYIQDRLAPDANIHVVPNAIPDWYTWQKLDRSKIIVYRGGRTHHGDVDGIARELARVLEEFPDWHLMMRGAEPWPITTRLDPKRYTLLPMISLIEFHRWMRTCGAAVMIAPLSDCEFNRAKSSISWIESCVAGAAFLGPDFPEFDRPGCLNYKAAMPGQSDCPDFGAKLRALISTDQETRWKMVDAGRAWVDENARLSKANAIRRSIIDQLVPAS